MTKPLWKGCNKRIYGFTDLVHNTDFVFNRSYIVKIKNTEKLLINSFKNIMFKTISYYGSNVINSSVFRISFDLTTVMDLFTIMDLFTTMLC